MKITDLTLSRVKGRARVSAKYTWEDSPRPPQEIYFEVDPQFEKGLVLTPHTFLVPAVIPAMRQKERRVSIDAPICPELCENLEVAMAWLHQWRGDERQPVVIEAKIRRAAEPRPPERAALFFTGGVDSMATLRRNRLRFPREHPLSFRDGIIIYGLEVDRMEAFEDVLQSLTAVANDTQLELVPVYSNVRTLDDDWQFWEFEWEGSVYASVAHALSGRLTHVSISATYDVPHMNQLGSHPLLDPNFSSAELTIRHDGLTMSRFEKTRLIAGWESGFQHLRVCNHVEDYKQQTINCGHCEKCVRTMLALLGLGVLELTQAFGERNVSVDLVNDVVQVYSPYLEACYRDLLPALAAIGRVDLCRAIEQKIALRYPTNDWRTRFGRLDQKYCGGMARRLKRLILGAGTSGE